MKRVVFVVEGDTEVSFIKSASFLIYIREVLEIR